VIKQQQSICNGCTLKGRGFVPGEGPVPCRVMFIAEAPGADEAFRSHRPMTGKAGRLFDFLLNENGLERDSVYVTNTVKCNPPDNRDPTTDEVMRCSHYLIDEIGDVKPEIIIAVGAVALKNLRPTTNIEYQWGIPIIGKYETVIPIYHPALGYHMPRMLPMIFAGFKMAAEYIKNGYSRWEQDTVITNYKRKGRN